MVCASWPALFWRLSSSVDRVGERSPIRRSETVTGCERCLPIKPSRHLLRTGWFHELTGDGAIGDAETVCFAINSRIDDVLNVTGYRMGSVEIESALVSCTKLVAEAAVAVRWDETTSVFITQDTSTL